MTCLWGLPSTKEHPTHSFRAGRKDRAAPMPGDAMPERPPAAATARQDRNRAFPANEKFVISPTTSCVTWIPGPCYVPISQTVCYYSPFECFSMFQIMNRLLGPVPHLRRRIAGAFSMPLGLIALLFPVPYQPRSRKGCLCQDDAPFTGDIETCKMCVSGYIGAISPDQGRRT